jgi:pyruvate dehydrogenase E2 component (dihydrolipoamide acetyltransferase)
VMSGTFKPASLGEGATGGLSAGYMGIPPIPPVDFSKYGPIETQPLSRINKLSGANLHRAWLNIPHVTHQDEADITEVEAFRVSLTDEAKARDVRVTMLGFLLKASAAALKQFPAFNASLDATGENLILKQYIHIGVAVDTPDGLVVPVIRDVDKKSIFDLSAELGALSAKARNKKLGPGEMQGGCFTISSLGGIGGTAFTPIINAPEVAILGVTRSKMAPVWNGQEFTPRLLLPLSVSYDHRVIDGAQAARFTAYLARLLGDIRRLLL